MIVNTSLLQSNPAASPCLFLSKPYLQLHMQDQKACLAVQLAVPSAGVICNNVVPEWLRVVLLTALLLFVVYKTAKKGKR